MTEDQTKEWLAVTSDTRTTYSVEKAPTRDELEARIAELTWRFEKLLEASIAVVKRWDTPLWKDVPATATYINALRAAIEEAKPTNLQKDQ